MKLTFNYDNFAKKIFFKVQQGYFKVLFNKKHEFKSIFKTSVLWSMLWYGYGQAIICWTESLNVGKLQYTSAFTSPLAFASAYHFAWAVHTFLNL